MKHKNQFWHKGVTLIEIVSVLAIISILAAIAIPSALAFLESGRQTNRMNTARTIYLAAQDQLTELRITKNLKAGITRDYYDLVDDKYIENETKLVEHANVYRSLGEYLPAADLDNDNQNYVHYISKAKGEADVSDPVIQLLNPVILDQDILDDAILIEYNIKTGVVLSVFYGDVLSDGSSFTYSGDGVESVMGKRGMEEDGYVYASSRRHGYYGVSGTGSWETLYPAMINVYDSYTTPLPDDLSSSCKNVLYAQILIPLEQLSGEFNLLINDTIMETGVSLEEQTKTIGSLQEALTYYGLSSTPNTALMYRYDGDINSDLDKYGVTVPADVEYARIIWVLDYVGGNMTNTSDNNLKHSIQEKYAALAGLDGTSNLRVGITGSVSKTSLTQAHPYFFTQHQGAYNENNFSIRSTRHLYNIRYAPEGHFTQEKNIDLADGDGHSITNFAPIPELTGTYTGTYFDIKNLTITLPSADNTALFGSITGESNLLGTGYKRASVIGLTLEDPDITGKNNVGSVCGTLDGFMTGIYIRYTTDAKMTISGNDNVGGIVGNNNGILTDSTFLSPTAAVHISAAETNSAGGIAGKNNNGGKLRRVLFLALAPKAGKVIQPITGINSAAAANLSQLYYLSGTAIRPEDIAGSSDYNTETANDIGEGLDTAALYKTVFEKGWKKNLNGLSALTDEESTSLTNSIYPYPYSEYSEYQTAIHPDWPITESSAKLVSGITYYELYQDYSWGYTSDESIVSKLVLHDGYALEFSFYKGDYSFTIGDKSFTITGAGTEDNPNWTVSDDKGALSWPEPKSFEDNDGNVLFRLYIPNNILESFADGANPISLTFFKNSGADAVSMFSAKINPLFAPTANGVIRSPRHIDNIDRAPGGVYTQQLNVDFSLYCKELAADYDLDSNTKLLPEEAIVTGIFTGEYNGNGKLISNVTINAVASDNNIGLFEQNSGVIRNVTLQSASITGENQVGGIASNTIAGSIITDCIMNTVSIIGTNNVGGIAGDTAAGSTITDCKLYAVSISGTSNIGGIAGTHNGTITRSFVGMNPSGSSSENSVKGTSYVGGIAGVNMGDISISYVENTKIGTSSTSTNVGGIAGYMNNVDASIRNVFYNYGNAAPQGSGFVNTIVGTSGTTGGLVGYMNAGSLSNAYSDAYFVSGNNFLIGGNSVTNLGSSALYLKDTGYNDSTLSSIGASYNVKNLQTDAAVTALGGSPIWSMGSDAGVSNPRYYTYPRLTDLEEPKKWPLPNTTVYNFKYYEIYPEINPKTGGKYGLWSSEYDDQLDYTQKVLEDGYVLYGSSSPGNSGRYMVRDLNGTTLLGSTKTGELVPTVALGGVPCLIFNLSTLENLQKTSGNGIEPIRVTIGQGNASGAEYFDGYINPLFAKAIYSLNDIDQIGTIAQQQAYFQNEKQYIIRTPRQLNNVGFDQNTLAGHFTQEIDIDFDGLNTSSGYYRNNDVSTSNSQVSIDIAGSVVTGAFTGTYTALSPYDNQVKSIKNLTLPNPTPSSYAAAKAGSIGIFSQIGSDGVVENLILKNNTVSGTTGTVGGLTGVNEGTIRNISSMNVSVKSTTGKAGGIAGNNSGALENISFINSASAAPVTASNSSVNAGGITAANSGTITNALYIAHAPGSNPITPANNGTLSKVYYLSGTVSANNRPTESVTTADYNNFIAAFGEPRTSQELYALNLSGWTKNSGITNTLTSGYPYPYLWDSPGSWPVATVPADDIAYYEIYDNGDGTLSYGFYSIQVPSDSLDEEKPIIESGYCVIMPDSFMPGRTIRLNTRTNVVIGQMGNKNTAVITSVNSTGTTPSLITVNNLSSSVYINTMFAEGLYRTSAPVSDFIIRTPLQMQNIGNLSDTSGLTFTQKRNLDFTDIMLANGAVVIGEFKGEFYGNDKTIANVTINTPTTDNVGLFSRNSGVIMGITLKSVTEIIGNNNVGGIVGHNLPTGIVKACTVLGDEDSANPGFYTGIHIEGMQNVGKIAGLNDGDVIDCIPNDSDALYIGSRQESSTLEEEDLSNPDINYGTRMESMPDVGGSTGYNEDMDADADVNADVDADMNVDADAEP